MYFWGKPQDLSQFGGCLSLYSFLVIWKCMNQKILDIHAFTGQHCSAMCNEWKLGRIQNNYYEMQRKICKFNGYIYIYWTIFKFAPSLNLYLAVALRLYNWDCLNFNYWRATWDIICYSVFGLCMIDVFYGQHSLLTTDLLQVLM